VHGREQRKVYELKDNKVSLTTKRRHWKPFLTHSSRSVFYNFAGSWQKRDENLARDCKKSLNWLSTTTLQLKRTKLVRNLHNRSLKNYLNSYSIKENEKKEVMSSHKYILPCCAELLANIQKKTVVVRVTVPS
jgi:hypothetical protein